MSQSDQFMVIPLRPVSVAAIILVLLVTRSLARRGGRLRPGWHRDTTRLLAMLRANGNIFIRTLCLSAALFWFTAAGARLGDVTLAANAVLLHFHHLLSYGLDGFAFATEALAGSAFGARDRAAFRAAVTASTWMALAVAAVGSLLFVAGGGLLIDLLTSIPAVRAAAREFLPWMVLAPLVSVWSFQLDGIYIGATRTTEMRNGALLSLSVWAGVSTLAVPFLGNHGLWLAFMLWMLARATTLAAWYPRLEASLPVRPPD